MSSEPRYTIEQIELLRRLVRTGLTKEEIIHACDTMAKLDSELGPLPPRMEQPSVTSAASPPISNYQQQQTPVNHQLSITSRNSAGDVGGLGQDPNSPSNRTSLVSLLSSIGHSGYQENGDTRLGVDDFNVSNEEVEALFRKGHMNVKEDIKEFLNLHRLSQNQIAQATGISQSYISQFLLHGYVMRRSTQAILYRWYLSKKKELDALGMLNTIPSEPERQPPPRKSTNRYVPYQSPSQAPPSTPQVMASARRRERFVWKDNCLKVLEAYFKKNPYPNDLERIRLSDACNAMQQVPGQEIPEHCRVNPSKVYNWFANRRKDANRKKRMVAENLATRSASPHEGSLPDVEYIEDSSHDLTNEGDIQDDLDDERGGGMTMDQMEGSVDDHQDPAEVANQLVEVNNSIMTLMKAVEERHDEMTVKTEADTG